jgi:hypothetical protein
MTLYIMFTIKVYLHYLLMTDIKCHVDQYMLVSVLMLLVAVSMSSVVA